MPYRYLLLAGVLAAAPAAAQGLWSFTDGPTPGDVTALAAEPGGVLYAATYEGVRRSADGGQTWTMATPHPYAREATALAVVPGQRLFVGQHQSDFFAPQNVHGVVRVYPLDGPGTPGYPDGAWGAAGTTVTDVVAEADGRAWAAIGREVFAYAPFAGTWTARALPVTDVHDLHRTAAGALLAATSGGVYRSTDGGASWSPYALAGQRILAVTVGATGTTFAANQWGIVYRSADGATWTPISCGGVVLRLHPLPDGSVVGGTAGSGLVRTVNDGWSWQYAGGSEVVPALAGDAAGAVYAAAVGDGLRRSADAAVSWDALRWVDADVRHLAPLPDGRVVAVSARYYGAHAYAGGAWADLGLEGEEVYGAAADGSVLYALVKEGWFDTALLRSTDGGLNWVHRRTFENYATFAVGAGGVLLVSGHEGSLRSTDGGATWQQLAPAPFFGAMHHVGGGLFFSYVGGYPDALLRSTDNGLTWSSLGSPTFGDSLLPRLQAVVRAPDGALVAADADGLMRSTDEGVTWEAVAGGPTRVVAFARDAAGTLWAGRSEGFAGPAPGSGVWRSDDGATWAPDGLEGVRVHTLALGSGPTLLAGTPAGVYARSGLVVGTEGDGPPAAPALAVAPNPLGGRGAVTLTLDRARAVTVALYDALGRRVAVLHEGALAAGAHPLALDASGLRTGVYVVRAAAGEVTLTRRLTVVR